MADIRPTGKVRRAACVLVWIRENALVATNIRTRITYELNSDCVGLVLEAKDWLTIDQALDLVSLDRTHAAVLIFQLVACGILIIQSSE